jgi:hypothetical protein
LLVISSPNFGYHLIYYDPIYCPIYYPTLVSENSLMFITFFPLISDPKNEGNEGNEGPSPAMQPVMKQAIEPEASETRLVTGDPRLNNPPPDMCIMYVWGYIYI